jgi:hypothetical protein
MPSQEHVSEKQKLKTFTAMANNNDDGRMAVLHYASMLDTRVQDFGQRIHGEFLVVFCFLGGFPRQPYRY